VKDRIRERDGRNRNEAVKKGSSLRRLNRSSLRNNIPSGGR
jgi:hypothetical protein